MSGRIAVVAFALLAAAGFLVAPSLVLGAPIEPQMGFIQKIFYFHVPCAWLMMLATIVSGVGSAIFLFKKSDAGDELAVAAAELVVVFGLCVLVTGPIWARKAWGVWWQWDARLTSSLLLWLIFVGYLLVRRYGGPGSRTLAAALSLFGAADVPLIYVSVSIWRTIHPRTSVVPKLDPAMRPAFFLSLTCFTLLFVPLLLLRLQQERAKNRLDRLAVALAEAEDA